MYIVTLNDLYNSTLTRALIGKLKNFTERGWAFRNPGHATDIIYSVQRENAPILRILV